MTEPESTQVGAGRAATEQSDECWFCSAEHATEGPPGGWIYEDAQWRAWHGFIGPVGTTVLESRRHVLDFAGLVEAEASSYGRVVGRVFAAIKSAVGADRVYTWSTMDMHPHLHLWLIPWWSDSTRRGTGYLPYALENDGATPDELVETAERMRALLASAEPLPS